MAELTAVQFEIVGSYRRGASYSSTIKVHVWHEYVLAFPIQVLCRHPACAST